MFNIFVCKSELISGVENSGLDLHQKQISRAIGVPFTPTIGCRINFKDIPLESLTPCSMLANKLVFTPGPITSSTCSSNDITPKKSKSATELSTITEEAAIDINEELDCYQLELENSINEAKSVKKKRRSSGRKKNLMDLKNRQNFAFRLSQAEDGNTLNNETDEESEQETEDIEDYSKQLTPKCEAVLEDKVIDQELKVVKFKDCNKNGFEVLKECPDVVFEEVVETSDDEFQFKNPAPFVRTFRRKSTRKTTVITKSTSNTDCNQHEPCEKVSSSTGIRNSIRKSFRKLINNPKRTVSSEKLHAESGTEDESSAPSSNIFSSIRQSFRRKAKPAELTNTYEPLDVSVVVDVDRKVFKQKTETATNELVSDDNAFPKKSSLRSSFRNTTKDVRRQVYRSMFKKNVEEYEMAP